MFFDIQHDEIECEFLPLTSLCECDVNGNDIKVANANNNRTVVIDLIGELAIQKAPPGYRGM